MKILGLEIRKSRPEKRENQYTDFGDALLFGKFKSNYAAMNLSAVFRCVDLISDSIGMLPIKVVKEDLGCKNEVPNHSLNLVFKEGITNITYYQFIKMLVQSVLLKGNGFAYIERADDGTVIGLRFLESNDVNIFYDKGRKKSLYYTCNLFPNKKIEPCNMLHLYKYSLNGVEGKSVLGFADRTLKLAQNGENQANNLFSNGCNLSGVLTVEGSLTKEQRKSIHSTWNQSMVDGGDGLAVLQGNMKYQPIQINPEDAQLLESRLFQVEEIARFFGINPILIGDLSHSSYSTLEAAQQEFLLHTLQPYITMIEQEFTRKLFRPSESNLRINLDETAILKTDKQAVASYYSTLLNSGVLCVNEVRKELGYNEIEGGEKHLISYTKIEDNIINKKDDERDNIQMDKQDK